MNEEHVLLCDVPVKHNGSIVDKQMTTGHLIDHGSDP
jgi:hypothetical protein